MQAFIQPGNCYARETLTSSGTAQGCTKSVYHPISTANGGEVSPRFAIVTVETNPIRYTRSVPAVTPVDATPVGQLHSASTPYPLVLTNEGQIQAFQFVQNTGAAKVHIEYFR
jgi:hypothetical protein